MQKCAYNGNLVRTTWDGSCDLTFTFQKYSICLAFDTETPRGMCKLLRGGKNTKWKLCFNNFKESKPTSGNIFKMPLDFSSAFVSILPNQFKVWPEKYKDSWSPNKNTRCHNSTWILLENRLEESKRVRAKVLVCTCTLLLQSRNELMIKFTPQLR